jgi:uncharacterized protein (DUF4415 family)
MNDTRASRHALAEPKSEKELQSSYQDARARDIGPGAKVGNLNDGDIDWSDAESLSLPKKTLISIRLDDDIIAFFKQAGSGYQTRINAVLRHFMEYRRGRKPHNSE